MTENEESTYVFSCNACSEYVEMKGTKEEVVRWSLRTGWSFAPYMFDGLETLLRICPKCNNQRTSRKEEVRTFEALMVKKVPR